MSERPLRALPYVVNFSSLASKLARPESRECYNLIFPGERLRLGPNFLHLIKERMVLYLLVSILALSVPGLLGQISEKYKISLFRGEGASGLNGLALSERPLRALPYVVNFSSLGSKPARPESREFYNLIFPGGRLRLGPNILHLIKERMVLYLVVSISARSVLGLLCQISEKFSISLFRG